MRALKNNVEKWKEKICSADSVIAEAASIH